MTRVLRWGGLGVATLVLGGLAASFAVSRPDFDEGLDPARLQDIAVAAPDVALSFARLRDGTTVLVRGWKGGRIEAVRAGSVSALELLRVQGYDGLQRLAESGEAIAIDPTSLDVPFDGLEQNIGVGLNYAEHAQESQLEAEPFLFPKFGAPTRWNSDIAKGRSGRLDYEAELGLVALRDLAPGDAPAFGLVLANEMTDRLALVKSFRRGEPMGTTGFADGKSREGFAPLGPLLVVPRDFEAYWRTVRFELWVDGRLRQRESAARMSWPPARILAECFARAGVPMHYGGGTVSLLPRAGIIPAGAVIFSGTPAGVIFRPLNVLNPWVYLQPGDEVVLRADGLGVIRNRITR